MTEVVSAVDECTCTHARALHGFEGTCTVGWGAGDTGCLCQGFVSAPRPTLPARDPDPEALRLTVETSDGFWLVVDDKGARAGFPDELTALRYAVANRFEARFQGWGVFE